MLTKDEFAELFEAQVRGALATAFVYGKVSPGENYWPMIRGEKEMTMRAIGEIGHLTGHNMYLQLSSYRQDEATATEEE